MISEAPEETTGRYTLRSTERTCPWTPSSSCLCGQSPSSWAFTVTWNGDGTVTVDSGEMHTTITIGEDSYQAITSIEGLSEPRRP